MIDALMSQSTEEKTESDNKLNIPGILADFFLKKIEMDSHDYDSGYKHKKKKSKHKKEKHKKLKHSHRSRSSSSSSGKLYKRSEPGDRSSSEEIVIQRLKKIKKLSSSIRPIKEPAFFSSSVGTKESGVSNENLVFYGPSLELLISGVDRASNVTEFPSASNEVHSNVNSNTVTGENARENPNCTVSTLNSTNENSFPDITNKTTDVSVIDSLPEITDKAVALNNIASDASVHDGNLKSNHLSSSKFVFTTEDPQTCNPLISDASKIVPTVLANIKDNSTSNILINECKMSYESDKPESGVSLKSNCKKLLEGENEISHDTTVLKDNIVVQNKQTILNTDRENNHKYDCKNESGAQIRSHSRSRSKTKVAKKMTKYCKRDSRSLSSSSDSTPRKKSRHSKSSSPDRRNYHQRAYSRSRSRSRYLKTRRYSGSRSPKQRRSRSRSHSRKRRHSRSDSKRQKYLTSRYRSRSRTKCRSNRNRSYSRSCSRSRSYKRNSRDEDRSASWLRNRSRNRRSKSRSKSRSLSRGKEIKSKAIIRSRSRSKSKGRKSQKIDQAKVLETARKNVLKMMKSGTLPEGLPIDNLKKEQLISLQAGGKSVQELTDFCQRLSQQENEPEGDDETSKDNEPVDDDSGFIHHPFKIKEPGTIKMNIRNAVQLPIKTHSQKIAETARLSSQFPVSSGNQHKQKELEWVPVVPESSKSESSTSGKKTDTPNTPMTVALIDTSSDSVPLPPSSPPPPLPPPPPPEPVSYPVPNSVKVSQADITTDILPLMPPPMPPQLLLPSEPVPAPPPVPPISAPPPAPELLPAETQEFMMPVLCETATLPVPSQSVFKPRRKIDISAIVAKRFQALTKLNQNENDPEALKILQDAQEDIQEWVESQQVPGMFTGSTDAKILSAAELCGPKYYSFKCKKDFFTQAPPVSGGKGMSLLKKMGWNPGEGLGKNKEGSLEPLLIDIKMDKKGLVSEGENSKKIAMNNSFMKELQGKHPVSALMELCSKRKWKPPLYSCIMDVGPPHKKQFCFKVEVNGVEYQPLNPCNNKKIAKADAAVICLQALNVFPKSTAATS